MSAIPMPKPPIPMAKPPVAAPAKPPMAKPPSKPTAPARVAKTFAVADWNPAAEGQKIVLYGKSGVGKSTLACMAPNAVFIGIDDGGRRLSNPLTGQPIKCVPGVESFQDLRDVLHQPNLFPDKGTIVIDTITKLEAMLEPYIFENYQTKNGKAKAMRDYGWDGPAHLLDCTRLLLADLDAHVRAGRNVILLAQLAQVRVSNSKGTDYLEDGPKLQHNNQYSSRTEVCEWADHVFFVGYSGVEVVKDDAKAKAGKIKGELDRAVFSGGAMHFIAKSRPINGYRIPAEISFESPADNSVWQFVFEGARVE